MGSSGRALLFIYNGSGECQLTLSSFFCLCLGLCSLPKRVVLLAASAASTECACSSPYPSPQVPPTFGLFVSQNGRLDIYLYGFVVYFWIFIFFSGNQKRLVLKLMRCDSDDRNGLFAFAAAINSGGTYEPLQEKLRRVIWLCWAVLCADLYLCGPRVSGRADTSIATVIYGCFFFYFIVDLGSEVMYVTIYFTCESFVFRCSHHKPSYVRLLKGS